MQSIADEVARRPISRLSRNSNRFFGMLLRVQGDQLQFHSKTRPLPRSITQQQSTDRQNPFVSYPATEWLAVYS